MKEINIAKTIVDKRREMGITQEDLAEYIGVSKASVSKWETGQSYPDITFLPKLAAYFNVSIDELMNYSPQLTREAIKKLYHELAGEFSVKPFDQVHDRCRALIKKYYSCFPFLLQMSILYMNHHMLAGSKEQGEALLEEAIGLCLRVHEESGDGGLISQADRFHAGCLLMLNRPVEVIDLLDASDELHTVLSNHENWSILANAYFAIGKMEEAERILQLDMYDHLMVMINEAPMLLSINGKNMERAEMIIERIFSLVELFDLETLNFNGVLIMCLEAGAVYNAAGNREKALEYLTRYTDICCRVNFPTILHGDDFFDRIEGAFDDLPLGMEAPRDEKVVRESMIQALAANAAFSNLTEVPEFQNLIRRLESLKGEEK